MTVEIGVIGGSGLYDMAELTDREERSIATPFGDPSGAYVIGTLRGKRVAFLPRHDVGHRLMPSELNFRANIPWIWCSQISSSTERSTATPRFSATASSAT
jgi:5'-methylthioadenosine phosphorylase